MLRKLFPLFIFLFILSFSLPTYTLAQTTNLIHKDIACPGYKFNKDLAVGITNEDVFVMQQILNTDKRTLIAQTGPGSRGNETGFFGQSTREALKRFQALFIEYIEVADGRFNERTRIVMNGICGGDYFNGKNLGVIDPNVPPTGTDALPPIIGISGPSEIRLADGKSIRMYLGSSKAILTPTLMGIILSGATASDVRKTSSTTFTFLVTANEDVGSKITVQFEADSVEDLFGKKNSYATNEWEIKVIRGGTGTTTGTSTGGTSTLDDILNGIINKVPPATDCSKVASVNVYDYSNPCYGRVPMVGDQSSGGGSGGAGGIGMLTNILNGLLTINTLTNGAIGRGISNGIGSFFGGGTGSLPGFCVCTPNTVPPGMLTGQPTIMLLPVGGVMIPGRYLMTKNPSPGGKYIGAPIPFVGPVVCGQAIRKVSFGSDICINPSADSTGQRLIGDIPPPSPAFRWSF